MLEQNLGMRCFLAGRGHGYGEDGQNQSHSQRFSSGRGSMGLQYLVCTCSRPACAIDNCCVALFVQLIKVGALVYAGLKERENMLHTLKGQVRFGPK